MSDRVPYVQHGRRHGPGGSDPIPGTFPRVSWGSMYGDGTLRDAGSGDWSVGSSGNVVVITFAPAFAARPAIVITPSYDDSFTDPPDFGTFNNYTSGLPVTGVNSDLAVVSVAFYDPDGNPFQVSFFDFEAVSEA